MAVTLGRALTLGDRFIGVSDLYTLLALQHLAETSQHKVVRSQARGALWILDGKEQKTPSFINEVSSTVPGSLFTSFTLQQLSPGHCNTVNSRAIYYCALQ